MMQVLFLLVVTHLGKERRTARRWAVQSTLKDVVGSFLFVLALFKAA
jgi:hypothetical protein